MPEVHLTPDEVAALVLAGSVARAAPGTTYAEVVDLALKKLAFDSPARPDTPDGPAARRPREPVLVHFPRPGDAAKLAERLGELEQAIGNHKRVTVRYVDAGAKETTRDVDPYGLAYRHGTWLLVGHCHLRGRVCSFRVDRIADVVVAPKPRTPDFDRPEGFDLRRYTARSPWTFENEPPVDVELEVLPAAASVAQEDFGDKVERIPGEGGRVTVRWPCTNPDYLVSRVLEAKGALVVRAPDAVRARVREELRRVAALYEP